MGRIQNLERLFTYIHITRGPLIPPLHHGFISGRLLLSAIEEYRVVMPGSAHFKAREHYGYP